MENSFEEVQNKFIINTIFIRLSQKMSEPILHLWRYQKDYFKVSVRSDLDLFS